MQLSGAHRAGILRFGFCGDFHAALLFVGVHSLALLEIENKDYLTTQLITYIGNKRALLEEIDSAVNGIKQKLGRQKCVCADLFSGSGVVSRSFKRHSSLLISNDLEEYAEMLNSCYLSNQKDFDRQLWLETKEKIEKLAAETQIEGIIARNYAPKDSRCIKPGERAFYTRENALRIDTFRYYIDKAPEEMRKFFLAPLLTEASVHVNTSGVFKGFYKDKNTGIGCFGAAGKDALSRILGAIELKMPVLSNYECAYEIYRQDAVELASQLKAVDIAYLDPPYNQHPYGSNYFMLNLILKNKIDTEISKVSGITQDWNRSDFNKAKTALASMEAIVSRIDSKFLVISYNSEGFISFEEMTGMLKKYGKLETREILYNTFRGSRNLRSRPIHVSEYLFILEKD